jgi:hypothetical protein
MSVFQVVYRNDGIEEVISLDGISSREDLFIVKENIYCSSPGCNCKMVYVPRGVNSEYFKKLRGDNHDEDCPHYVFTGTDGRPRRVVGVSNFTLSSDRKKDILKGIYNTYLETEDERQARLERQRIAARNRRRNQRVNNNNNNENEVNVNRPTTSNNGESLAEGVRSAPVRRRHSILDVADSDIGNTIVVIGNIGNVDNSDNRSIITLNDTQNRQEFKLYLERVFYENSPLNIPQWLEGLERYDVHNTNIIVSSVGEVILRNDEKGMLVLAEEDLRFNGVRLATFFMNNNVA